MINNSFHSILADIALADFLVPVLMGTKRIFRIIEMYCLEPVKTDYLIKFLQNAVKIINNVIAGIINMARIKANADFIIKLHLINNCTKFLKASANLRSLACHGFKQNSGSHFRKKHLIKRFGYKVNSDLCALTRMRTRMEIIKLMRSIFHSF